MRTVPLLAIAAGMILSGCAAANYSGETLPRSAHVDVFYVEAEIEQAFSVMGTADVGSDGLLSATEGKLAEVAMAHGADAIVVDGLSAADAGSIGTGWAEGNGRPRYIVDLSGGLRNVGGAEHHARLSSVETGAITARLLKYDR